MPLLLVVIPDADALTLATPDSRLELLMAGWHVDDLEPPLAGTAIDGLTGTPVSLVAANTVAVHVKKADGTIINRAPVLVNQAASPGAWTMAWQALDLSVAGGYIVEVEVTWPGARPQTFGPSSFQVARQLA